MQIWVTGIPHEYDEAAVREYWSYCGEVESMHLLSFADSGRFNGTAFVTFKTQVCSRVGCGAGRRRCAGGSLGPLGVGAHLTAPHVNAGDVAPSCSAMAWRQRDR